MDCMAVRDLDIHARCECCGSDSVTLAQGAGMGRSKAIAPDQPLPFIFRIAAGLGGRRAVMRQTLWLVSRARRAASAQSMPTRETALLES
jgi:hypothetical protein